MKTKNNLYLLAVSAAALSLSISMGSGQVFDPVEALNNRAVASSPRAKEMFPWLTRTATPRTEVCCSASELSDAKNNRAFAASPRTLGTVP